MSLDTAAQSTLRIAFNGAFRREDVRELSRRVHEGLGSGGRCFIIDLTSSPLVAERSLMLGLVGLRVALRRVDGCLIIAANEEVAERLGRALHLDDTIGVATSRGDAMGVAHRLSTRSDPAPRAALDSLLLAGLRRSTDRPATTT